MKILSAVPAQQEVEAEMQWVRFNHNVALLVTRLIKLYGFIQQNCSKSKSINVQFQDAASSVQVIG